MLKPLRNFYYSTLCTYPGYKGVSLIMQYIISQHTLTQNLCLMNMA